MITKTEMVISSEGDAFRVEYTPVTIPDSILQGFVENASVRSNCLVSPEMLSPSHEHRIKAIISKAKSEQPSIKWAVVLKSLRFVGPIKVIEGGIVTPDFAATTGADVELTWTPTPDMKLVFAVETHLNKGVLGDENPCCAGYQYLMAIDQLSHKWLLPTGNVYEDCRICTGQFNACAPCHLDVLRKCIDQFYLSKWNGDLYSGRGESEGLFRFHPNPDSKGFFQLGITQPTWQDACIRVSHEELEIFANMIDEPDL